MPSGGGGGNDDVGRVGEESSLDGIGDLIGQLDGGDVLCAKGGELFNGF